MTEPLFFDTDCLSAFLWINDQSLLAQLYPKRIVIPAEVYLELSRPSVPHLKKRIDAMLQNHDAEIDRMRIDSKEYRLYKKLTECPDPGHMIIGRGEAAAIALAKERKGILASNNLRDIAVYVKEFQLEHKTTGVILKEALELGFITEEEGNQIWQSMLRRKRKLGYRFFTEFLQKELSD